MLPADMLRISHTRTGINHSKFNVPLVLLKSEHACPLLNEFSINQFFINNFLSLIFTDDILLEYQLCFFDKYCCLTHLHLKKNKLF